MEKENGWSNSIIIRWKLIYLVLILWALLALIFGIYDLQISIEVTSWTMIPGAIGNFIKTFGEFGADYGEGPSWGLIFVAIAILIGSISKNYKKQIIPAIVIVVLFGVLLCLGIILSSEDLIWYGGFISTTVLIFLILILIRKYDMKKIRNLAWIIFLLAIINPLLFVNVLKPLCGRVRFRDLAPDFSNYTPWFLPPGPDFDNLSFPSGHTAMGWMFLPLLILFRNKKKGVKIITSFLIIGWGIFVGFSRIIVGAHYASDVLFPTCVAFLTVIFLYKKFYF
ncbi:MAG: phosphatase PAP2 family protein [Candidatus Helarchaeota archaeon]